MDRKRKTGMWSTGYNLSSAGGDNLYFGCTQLWEGAIGERHNMILGHECCAEVVEVGEVVKDFKQGPVFLIIQSRKMSGGILCLHHSLIKNFR